MPAYGVRRSDVQPDVVDTLLSLGLNRSMATMTIPYVWFRPATTDPYSPVTIGIVHAIQETLRQMGIATRGDGFVDAQTSAALRQISGPNWKSTAWLNVIDDVLYARATGKQPKKEKPMGYMTMGGMTLSPDGRSRKSMGDVASSAWCSDKNPQPNCKALKNICKPMDAGTLNTFKSLQRSLNSVLSLNKKTLLDVDGRLGPKTVAAVNLVLGENFKHCDELSAVADKIAANAVKFAGLLSAPTVPDPRRAGGSPPSVALKDGSVFNPPAQGGFTQFVTSPLGLASIVAGVVLFSVMTSKPKKKKKVKKARKPRRLAKQRITRTFY